MSRSSDGRTTDQLSAPATFASSVVAAVDAVAPARDELRHHLLQQGVGSALTGDVVLVASELISNAVVQHPAAHIRVEALVSDDAVELVVCNGAVDDEIPPRLQWGPDALLATRGRGLAIVETLSEVIEVRDSAGWTCVFCSLARHP